MLENLFAKKPVLDDEAIAWMFEGFSWALKNLGGENFKENTILVEPSNRHFPGRETSEHGMAQLIFEQVKQYAGVSHWPCQLIDRATFEESGLSILNIRNVLASQSGEQPVPLLIPYEPLQARNPEVMIANYAYTIAYHMADLSPEPLPCKDDQWPYFLELIAVYLGFGVMMVNTALPQRGGGCGSCRSPLMERHGFLSENEVTYALAIFCVLKGISAKDVAPLIKKHERPFLKKAMKDVAERSGQIQVLTALENGKGQTEGGRFLPAPS